MADRTRSSHWLRVLTVAIGILVGGAHLSLGLIPVQGALPTIQSASLPKQPVPVAAQPVAPSPAQAPAVAPEGPYVECTTAHISAPTIKLEAEVGEYTHEQVLANGGINPPVFSQAVWYSRDYRHKGKLSVMSNRAEDVVYIAGHASLDASKGAVFSELGTLSVGDAVTVTACGEVVALTVQVVKEVDKLHLNDDPDVYTKEDRPGTWVFVTCDADGPRSSSNATLQNVAVVLKVQSR